MTTDTHLGEPRVYPYVHEREEGAEKFFVYRTATDENLRFLHADLTWHKSVINDADEPAGLFGSESEAKAALNRCDAMQRTTA